MVNEPHDDDASERALMVEAATAVYGPGWRRPLAEAIGASHVTLSAVVAGRPLSAALRRRLGRWAAQVRAVEREAARQRLLLLARVEAWDDLEKE